RKNLTQKMIKSIPIRFIDMNAESNITNPHTGNNSLGIGGQRDCKGILRYIIPYLVHENILTTHDPIIHLRISGNGRNVGQKVKHVMVTFMILNDQKHHHVSSYHYTVTL